MKGLLIIYGNRPREMVKKLLYEIDPVKELSKNSIIGLKPNLVLAKPATSGATTSPEIAAGIIEYLQERGFFNIHIMEGSWVGDSTKRAYKVCGYENIAQRYKVTLIDLKDDLGVNAQFLGETFKVCETINQVDYLINLPVLKGHCQTKLTCALKNLKGCIPDSEKRRFHSLGLHKPIAYLNGIIKANLHIVDGVMGDLTFEEGGNPVEMGRIIAGTDPVLVDSYVAELMGYEISEVKHLQIAHKIGLGQLYNEDTSIQEIDRENMPAVTIKPGHKVKHLAKWINENQACSPCYGSLIHALDKLDDMGLLRAFTGKISIGRGYKDSSIDGIGIGICTNKFSHNIAGCPPRAKDIVKHLENVIKNA